MLLIFMLMENKIETLLKISKHVVVTIEGPCACGKTTLAHRLNSLFGGTVIHTDSFFLPPEKRTAERYREIGGNIDYERFYEEVTLPLSRGDDFSYRKFDCTAMSFTDTVTVNLNGLIIVEGSYSMHPKLALSPNLSIFVECDLQERLDRILRRNGEETLDIFREKWIPMEDKYLEYFKIREKCDIVLEI